MVRTMIWTTKQLVIPFLLLTATIVLLGEDDYSLIAESDGLKLYYRYGRPAIRLIDKGNNYRWDSSLDEERLEGKRLNGYWNSAIDSLFTFYYTDFQNQQGLSSSSGEEGSITEHLIPQGIEITFSFTELNIQISTRIFLRENALFVSSCRIDPGDRGLRHCRTRPPSLLRCLRPW